jgi:hypothetical protein
VLCAGADTGNQGRVVDATAGVDVEGHAASGDAAGPVFTAWGDYLDVAAVCVAGRGRSV